MRCRVVRKPLTVGVPATQPDHRVLLNLRPAAFFPVIIVHKIAQLRIGEPHGFQVLVVIPLLGLQQQTVA